MSIIIITGMHRSGTSLVAGILRTAGLHIGDKLLGPDDFNPRGFFEDKDFVNLQENILESRQLDYLLTENIKIALSDCEVSCAKKLISARSKIGRASCRERVYCEV